MEKPTEYTPEEVAKMEVTRREHLDSLDAGGADRGFTADGKYVRLTREQLYAADKEMRADMENKLKEAAQKAGELKDSISKFFDSHNAGPKQIEHIELDLDPKGDSGRPRALNTAAAERAFMFSREEVSTGRKPEEKKPVQPVQKGGFLSGIFGGKRAQ